ncbi:hypothetical protein ILYODFUR_023526 [Ilyodon furcidens]|uniref:Uncharacterized protein n=1 Tax=Ilyodon furcidens TaxID=33524 RepID=A0ABV0UUJ4_9TELE
MIPIFVDSNNRFGPTATRQAHHKQHSNFRWEISQHFSRSNVSSEKINMAYKEEAMAIAYGLILTEKNITKRKDIYERRHCEQGLYLLHYSYFSIKIHLGTFTLLPRIKLLHSINLQPGKSEFMSSPSWCSSLLLVFVCIASNCNRNHLECRSWV